MKRLIIAFITWMLVGVTVTAAWAAGPAKPVIEAEMPDCYAYIGGDGIILFTNAFRRLPQRWAPGLLFPHPNYVRRREQLPVR